MSDRLNLGPDRQGWADVNLCDHPTMESAVRAFANRQQSLKVFGPPEKIRECRALWERIEAVDPDFPPAAVTYWDLPDEEA